MITLRSQALAVVQECNPVAKAASARAVDASAASGTHLTFVAAAGIPGRPREPRLVAPAALVRRSLATPEGHAAMIHALAHIELNAIDLAADACWRFADMPDDFYRDWTKVMVEEALHFTLLSHHLATLGHAYGDYPAHNALWEMAERTRDDALARMALVPRTLEARGLDASPAVRHKLASIGDRAGAAIVDRILADEIGHVEIGNRWYRWLCERRDIDPIATYAVLAERHHAPRLAGPFNLDARRKAGFVDAELQALTAIGGRDSVG